MDCPRGLYSRRPSGFNTTTQVTNRGLRPQKGWLTMANYLPLDLVQQSSPVPVAGEDALRASYFATIRLAAGGGNLTGTTPVSVSGRQTPVAGVVYQVETGRSRPVSFGAFAPARVLARKLAGMVVSRPSGRVEADYRVRTSPPGAEYVASATGAQDITPAERRDRAARRAAHQAANQAARVERDRENFARYLKVTGSRVDRSPGNGRKGKR